MKGIEGGGGIAAYCACRLENRHDAHCKRMVGLRLSGERFTGIFLT
jgi:hypothetical protein